MSDIPYSVRGGRTSTSVAGLTDTTITNLQNQQILKYDSASQKWVNAVDGGGGATISSLGDTLISNPQTNQSLVYNATVSPARWENQVTPFTQSDFTNAVSTDAAFIKHKPIISTTSSSTMVGMNTGVNKEGDLTAFGKGAGNAAKDGHICIGQISGNQGAARAISLGYNTHSTHDNSVVIHGGSGRSSSAANAFYIDPLRTINALTETAGNMKINMYNTSTKEIFLTDNLLVPGKTKLNGSLEVSNGLGTVNQVLTSNNTGALTWTDKSQLTYSATGTGLSLTGTVFQNTKPDETVVLNNGSNINVTGTYPQFTINSTDTNTTYTAAAGGTGLSLTGTVFENTKPDLTVVLNNGSNVNVTGTYPSFTINSTDTNTTYTNGSNMSLVGTEFNIPQSVATTASPSFTALTLGNTGTNQGVINLQDVTNTGRDTVANIKGFKDGTNGGDLQFFTKVDGGNVTPKLRINNEGKLGFRGANYGTANQYLKNNASGLPEWTTVTSVSQAPLDTPVVATPSGTGNVTLTSGSGYNTLLTFTPPDTVTNATNASVLVGGHNVVCVSAPPLGGGGSGVPYLYSTAGLGYVPVNDVHVYFADYANKCPILTGVFDVYTAIVNNTNYLHSNRMVGGYQNDNLHVYGCHRASTTSDDRLKHNEVIITNGLEIARKLVPKAYDMTEEMLIKDYTGDLENSKRGSGFIAQELLEIPELSHAVQENSDPENTPYRVNYAETIAYAFAAIKELDAIVHTLQARIDVLESR